MVKPSKQKNLQAVSSDASAPRYRKIVTQLLESITDGDYPVGSTLPTESELCTKFNASRFTVREALRWLSEHGIVERRRGAGTTVTATGPSNAFVYRLSSISQLLKYPSETYRQNLFNGVIHADPELSNQLECAVGTQWYRISGLRLSDSSDTPISWSDIYVLPEYEEFLQDEGDGRMPVYEQIEAATGTIIYDAIIRIFASALHGNLASQLEVAEGTPALTIIRRYLDEQGRNFETTVTVHPEKRFEYSMHISRDRFNKG